MFSDSPEQRGAKLGLWGKWPPTPYLKNIYTYIYIYIYVLILAILYTFCPLTISFFLLKKNIIDSFKSNIIVTNFSIIFLQIFERVNSY